jgi:tetratricopeptide (TPR) repeat protein
MSLRCAVLALLVFLAAGPSAAQPSGAAAPPKRPANAAAMYEFLTARRAEAKEDVSGAEAALQRAVALDPESAELRAELAAFFARQNRAADAVAAAERAIALDAGSEEAHRVLGLVNAAWADGVVDGPAGGTESAWREAAIRHLLAIQASSAMATDLGLQMTLARQLGALDRHAEAVPILERIVSQTGPAGEPASILAEAHRALGQFEQAAAVLERAASVSPRYYLALGDVYERQRKFEEAADAFEKGLKAQRAPGRELRLRRVSALLNIPENKGLDRALAALDEYLPTAPKDAAAHSLLARALMMRGDGPGAQKAATQALALEPRHLPTLALMAEYHRERYDYAAVAALLAPLRRPAATRPAWPRCWPSLGLRGSSSVMPRAPCVRWSAPEPWCPRRRRWPRRSPRPTCRPDVLPMRLAWPPRPAAPRRPISGWFESKRSRASAPAARIRR